MTYGLCEAQTFPFRCSCGCRVCVGAFVFNPLLLRNLVGSGIYFMKKMGRRKTHCMFYMNSTFLRCDAGENLQFLGIDLFSLLCGAIFWFGLAAGCSFWHLLEWSDTRFGWRCFRAHCGLATHGGAVRGTFFAPSTPVWSCFGLLGSHGLVSFWHVKFEALIFLHS